ncbi:Protein unc-13-like C [Mizuhopecten yessoensis]|uniref:Protein unc-13-like C n=1 Tax=Mizuhopecten yessoensis TaxID=6573 RepID=A0A210PK80_MIZYE|nr:Protein unc-13-like C [Mizuhopecten yessoensis]
MAEKRKTISISSSDVSFQDNNASKKVNKKMVKKAKTTVISNQPTLTAFKMDNVQLKKFGEGMMRAMSSLESKVCCIDQKLSEMVTVESLNDKFSKMATKTDLEKATSEIVNRLNDKVDILENRVFDLETTNDELKKKVTRLENNMEKMKEAISEVGYAAEKAEYGVNEIGQYTRKSSVRIFGLEDDRDEKVENTCEKVNALLQSKLEMQIQNSDIDIAHRLGRFDSKKNRSIIVKFICRRKKNECIANRYKLKGTGIVIKDDLTQENQHLLDMCYYDDRVKQSWSDNGKMYAQLVHDNSIHRIYPGLSIDELVHNHQQNKRENYKR